ncbi:MAG TPA: hypothetical protein DIW24_08090, partial [Bacteroidetes bacterium]|nr:hypothetical protein [Bacteroidota bacterium]
NKTDAQAPPPQSANLVPQVSSVIYAELAIGATMPFADHLMENVDGKTLSTKGVKGTKGTVVIFWCNTCPWVARYESRAISLANQYKNKGFGFIAVNPNDPVAYPEEAMGFMKTKAQEKQYPFPYVADAGSTLARAYGAARTPHVFLFDAADKLVYVGGIDDNPQKEAEAKPYLKNALDAVLSGKTAPDAKTRAFGCTIKWQEKS